MGKELIALQRFLNDIAFNPIHQVRIACYNKQANHLVDEE
jgi:hypothetical protein